ncbi:hypothetical protein [Oceanicoccus sp. KOV_DT_Chl]|uniref:hypothetical protein n=1 Tax=Oceanicoccus sp. KOV_DT_Chl TaxID=1904639 RepID=UPI000C7DB491|nr:hypothetical protein [Oceanicoccus sp. KOV_DT_Chl]
MKDITTVIVTILKADRFRYQWLSSPWENVVSTVCRNTGAELLRYYYADVRGAKLSMEDKLVAAKVPFDKVWEPSKRFAGGSEFHRINEAGKSLHRHLEHPLIGAPSSKQLNEVKKGIPDWRQQQQILEAIGVAIPKRIVYFAEKFYCAPLAEPEPTMDARQPVIDELEPIGILD